MGYRFVYDTGMPSMITLPSLPDAIEYVNQRGIPNHISLSPQDFDLIDWLLEESDSNFPNNFTYHVYNATTSQREYIDERMSNLS